MKSVMYSFFRVFGDKKDEGLSFLNKMWSKEAFDTLLKNPNLMQGQYLGACLDKCRVGSMTTCLWPTNVRGLMYFMNQWREVNNDNEALYHERPLKELYDKFDLPRINHRTCPYDPEHSGTFLDNSRTVRCANRSVEVVNPSLIYEGPSFKDSLTQTLVRSISKRHPSDTSRSETALEEPVEILDVCYSIIKEPKDLKLPFETVLRRLNIHPEFQTVFCGGERLGPCKKLDELEDFSRDYRNYSGICQGHTEHSNKTEFNFDGWDLAYYLKVWKEQGNAAWFAREQEVWPAREHLRICSD